MFPPPTTTKKYSLPIVFIEKLPSSSTFVFQTFYRDVDNRTITLSSYFHEKNKELTLTLMVKREYCGRWWGHGQQASQSNLKTL